MEIKDSKSASSAEKSAEAGLSSVPSQFPSTAERLITVSSVTVGNILVIGGLGWWADDYFHTRPWLTIAAMLIAFVSTQVMIYRAMQALLERKSKK